MSINFVAIRDALIKWTIDNTGLTYAIWSDQDAPQPYDDDELKVSSAYVILRYSVTEQVAEDYETPPPDSGGVSSIVGNREFTLYVEIKGLGALSYMNTLLDSLQKPTVRAGLYDSKVIYVDNFPIQNITGLDDTRFIERASMDVRFRTESIITDTVGVIENVGITGVVEDGDGNTVYNETVKIEI